MCTVRMLSMRNGYAACRGCITVARAVAASIAVQASFLSVFLGSLQCVMLVSIVDSLYSMRWTLTVLLLLTTSEYIAVASSQLWFSGS